MRRFAAANEPYGKGMPVSQQVLGFINSNRKAFRFLVIFALTFGACYFVFGVVPGIRLGLIQPYTHFLATAVAAVINVFGAGASTLDSQVVSPRFSIN